MQYPDSSFSDLISFTFRASYSSYLVSGDINSAFAVQYLDQSLVRQEFPVGFHCRCPWCFVPYVLEKAVLVVHLRPRQGCHYLHLKQFLRGSTKTICKRQLKNRLEDSSHIPCLLVSSAENSVHGILLPRDLPVHFFPGACQMF